MQNAQLFLAADAERRIDREAVRVLPEHGQTEAVYRRDSRGIQFREFPLGARRDSGLSVSKRLLQAVLKPAPDALPHLGSRGAGKGHDEQFIDIDRMLRVYDSRDNALGQNRGFSAARRRRNQKPSVGERNGSLLFFGPTCHRSVSSPAARSISAKTSSAFCFLFRRTL